MFKFNKKVQLRLAILSVLVLALVIAIPVVAQGEPPADPPSLVEFLTNLRDQVGSLVGLSALALAVIAVIKRLPFVTDEIMPVVIGTVQIVAVGVVAFSNILGFDIAAYDNLFGSIAGLLGALAVLVLQTGTSRVLYQIAKQTSLPILGYSRTP